MTQRTGPKPPRWFPTWRRHVRGEVFRLRPLAGLAAHEQAGAPCRPGAVRALPLSTSLVPPALHVGEAGHFPPPGPAGRRAEASAASGSPVAVVLR